MSLLSTVIIENMDGAVVYVYVGPCRLIHAELCYAALAIHVELIGESCVLLLISFSFRLWPFSSTLSTGNRTDNRAKLLFICFIATIPAVIAMVTSYKYDRVLDHLLEHPDLKGRLFSVFNMTATHILSKENILPRVSIGYVMFVYLTASPILFVLRRITTYRICPDITSKICLQGASSDKSRHQAILRSLTIQMALPLFFSLAFFLGLVDFMGIYQLKAFQRSKMPISSTFTLISPIIILYYLPPYRKY
ncbi:hypothetical protein PENTCL1PPCAC_3273, partial [Pristionchus entomophagus]